ncbi:MAG: calcium/sodium antiporter [Acidobacteria bacterium]|nr:calcium/sodium antiporter [Acidobacteriota bacterium]MYG76727.1 calcium/sodium antiporter [Acidobacteriota bacterium]
MPAGGRRSDSSATVARRRLGPGSAPLAPCRRSCLILLACVFALFGFAGLTYGADWFVDGASGLARRFHISPLVIGLTVVAYGTSAPEIGTCLVAVLGESPGLAVGNVIGSNAANLGLILGITAVMTPFAVPRGLLRREFWFMLGATILLWPLAAAGVVSRPVGFVLAALLIAFNVLSIRWGRGAEPGSAGGPDDGADESNAGRSLTTTAVGLIALLVGAELLVRGASDIARALGASETVIGLTLVAIGTSLPELATSVAAGRRGQIQIVAGNVIGSNLFNVLGALGISAAVMPVAMEPSLTTAEVPGVVLLTLLAGVFMLTGRRVARVEGAVLLAAYAGYLIFVVL